MIARQRGAAPVESRNNVEAGQKEKKVTGSLAGVRRSSNEVTINFGSRPASGATAARPSPKFKSRLRPNFKLTIPSYLPFRRNHLCLCHLACPLVAQPSYHLPYKLQSALSPSYNRRASIFYQDTLPGCGRKLTYPSPKLSLSLAPKPRSSCQ